jgi:hypothetical protein
VRPNARVPSRRERRRREVRGVPGAVARRALRRGRRLRDAQGRGLGRGDHYCTFDPASPPQINTVPDTRFDCLI